MEKAIKLVLAVLFLGCLANMPYGYFQFVRCLGMVGFGLLAYYEKEKGNEGCFILWLLSAVLINPIFKISLGRTIWNIVDVIWAILLVFSAFNSKKSI